MPHNHNQHFSSPDGLSFSPSKTHSKLPAFHQFSNQPKRSNDPSPSLLIRSKFAHYNNQLLLPRCLQKSLNQKFALSPLSNPNPHPQSVFKLKNFFKTQQRPFDCPHYDDQQPSTNHAYRDDSYVRLSFLKENSDVQQDNKENHNYQKQLAQIMMAKSKLKYTPRATLRLTRTKCTDESKNSIQKSQQKFQNSILSKTSTVMNFRKGSKEQRKSHQVKELKPVLNSTRSKLLCQIEKISMQKITKQDIFPLERLMQKRAQKTHFRNKWFTSKTVENQVVDE